MLVDQLFPVHACMHAAAAAASPTVALTRLSALTSRAGLIATVAFLVVLAAS